MWSRCAQAPVALAGRLPVGCRQMTAKRTPLKRPQRRQITPAAVALFRRIQATDDGDDWWRAHAALHAELRCKPWEYPCVVLPDEDCPYPKGTSGAEWWPTAQALYRLLAQAEYS